MSLLDYLTANPTLLAAVCTILGGLLLKTLESWLGKHSDNRADRADYREEIRQLNERIDKLEATNTEWRKRAFAAEENAALLRIIIINMGGHLPEHVSPDELSEPRRKP